MKRKPRLLDPYCCQGGAGWGWWLAGFDVTGVDKDPQPRYPFTFHQGDAVRFILDHGHEFDAIAGSPPCQAQSKTWRINKRDHPRLIAPTREAMQQTGRPWIIENVEEALPELIDPVMLCGSMFPGFHTYRHRLFESPFEITVPDHPEHAHPNIKMGRALEENDWYHAVGNFSNVPYVKRDMGVPWMSRNGVRECIPPVYTYYIGQQLMKLV